VHGGVRRDICGRYLSAQTGNSIMAIDRIPELLDKTLTPGVVGDPAEDANAIERMLDDGAPLRLEPRVRRSRWRPLVLQPEPSADERAAQRRAATRVYRLYCFACGRSTEVLVAPARPGRCLQCGGTMLLEAVAPDY
jgi:hypothetical protein